MTRQAPKAGEDIPLRPPEQVMRLARMGSFHQSRLSFMRILLRRLASEEWHIQRKLFDIDKRGVGTAVYTARGPTRTYSLIAFGHDLPPERRSDRVIAEAWDATFTLFDGIPTAQDIHRLAQNVPLQEAGRITQSELSLSRANRSVRLFEHVVDRLSRGQQPDTLLINSVGYLMRTTAVYGSGKFGAADRNRIADRPEAAAPFQIEMLSVYLTRCFVMDLVEHMARLRAPETATTLEPTLRRQFGIGNSTGLGMAPFLINHPMLLNNWIAAREEALARVRQVQTPTGSEVELFLELLDRAICNASNWRTDHPRQKEKLIDLQKDLVRSRAHLATFHFDKTPWDRLYLWAEHNLSLEAQEQLVSLLMEPYPDLINPLGDCLSADETNGQHIDGAMTIGSLMDLLNKSYGWAQTIDWTSCDAQARAWYVSAEKMEPRLGERFDEPITDYELPLAPGRDAARMAADLTDWSTGDTVASFLLHHPEHRHIARRVQLLERCPYGEIRDNTIGADIVPIDMLRCKLSFFGAGHFDPRSDRWVRINMFRDAPFPDDLTIETADDWGYPMPPAP